MYRYKKIRSSKNAYFPVAEIPSMLSLPDIIFKFCIIAMFLIFNILA
jgi:hypothetical protein